MGTLFMIFLGVALFAAGVLFSLGPVRRANILNAITQNFKNTVKTVQEEVVGPSPYTSQPPTAPRVMPHGYRAPTTFQGPHTGRPASSDAIKNFVPGQVSDHAYQQTGPGPELRRQTSPAPASSSDIKNFKPGG